MPGVSMARVGAALVALVALFAGAWLIGHATRAASAPASGATSSLRSAHVQRVAVAIPELPANVVLPSLAAAHRSTSVRSSPTSSQSAAPAQSQAASQPAITPPSQSTAVRTYTPPPSSGSSGTSHASAPQHTTTTAPVVGGNN